MTGQGDLSQVLAAPDAVRVRRPEPANLGDMLNEAVDRRVDMRMRGRVKDQFNDVPDIDLVSELLARGWAVFRPRENDKP